METTEPMLPSPFKRIGGKSALRKKVIGLLPSDAQCYVETFGGAGWVLFGKLPHPVEVFNDADGNLMNLWRVLKWRPAELLENVHRELYSRERYTELQHEPIDQGDEMERAVRMYLLIHMSFGVNIGAGLGVAAKPPPPGFLRPSLERLAPASARLREVIVESMSYEQLFKRYDRDTTVFFCDPPYYGQNKYQLPFDEKEHVRLADALHNLQGRFLLTINDCPEVRELYGHMPWLEVDEQRALSPHTHGRKAAPILCIANYRIETPQIGY